MQVFGDIYAIASRVKEIDPALTLSYVGRGKYQVKRNNHLIMSVPHKELDSRILEKLRKGDLQRRRLEDIIYEMERSEDEAERRRAKELSNTVESITLDQYDKLLGIRHYALGGIK